MTDERILEIARKHQQYEHDSKVATLRGEGVLEFGRAIVAELQAEHMRELVQVRAALDGEQAAA
jgi:hypothetical protein